VSRGTFAAKEESDPTATTRYGRLNVQSVGRNRTSKSPRIEMGRLRKTGSFAGYWRGEITDFSSGRGGEGEYAEKSKRLG